MLHPAVQLLVSSSCRGRLLDSLRQKNSGGYAEHSALGETIKLERRNETAARIQEVLPRLQAEIGILRVVVLI